MQTRTRILAAATLVLAAALAHAQTVRIANQGDALSMDPIRSTSRCSCP